jgi:S-DNA-T family DNA segregation ATPase FtsK/SpoIIIE
MSAKSKRNISVAGRKYGEVWGIILIGLSVLLAVSFYFYKHENNPFMGTEAGASPGDYTGKAGAVLAFTFLFSLGLSAYILPIFASAYGILLIARRPPEKMWLKLVCLALLIVSGSCILHVQTGLAFEKWFPYLDAKEGFGNGGVLGMWLDDNVLVKSLGEVGSSVILIVTFLSALLVITEVELYPYILLFYRTGKSAAVLLGGLGVRLWAYLIERLRTSTREKPAKAVSRRDRRQKEHKKTEEKKKKRIGRKKAVEPKPVEEAPVVRKIVVPETVKVKPGPTPRKTPSPAMRMEYGGYELPSTELLKQPESVDEEGMYEDINQNSEILERTLLNFGIEAKVGEIHRGPVITRYEVHPAPGIKVTRVTSLSDDIALAMKAHRVRIVAPIPGKSAIGIEIPNKKSNMVCLREVLESKEFHESKAKIPIALGKSMDGRVVVADLAEMPHLLIAGATGSGKSVCINSAIMTMLFNLRPDQVKFIMIDPKKIELAMYNVLPHMLVPVITDSKKVANGLNWLVLEMEKRYEYLSAEGCRNIEAYNARPIDRKAKEGDQEEEDLPDRLPYIVAIIDELADLMMVSPQDVENGITRLAQLSRSVGIHLIIATQRPSVNVITGVIKANLPARISFQVASKVDSRTVIDANGAEKLIGNGDALFLPPGTSRLVRAQGTFVTDEEIRSVLDFVKEQAEPEFDHSILEKSEGAGESTPGEQFEDELFDDAVEITLLTGQASASNLQRRLRIGYARAARLIDIMESRGVIGPARGSKPREILVHKGDEAEEEL